MKLTKKYSLLFLNIWLIKIHIKTCDYVIIHSSVVTWCHNFDIQFGLIWTGIKLFILPSKTYKLERVFRPETHILPNDDSYIYLFVFAVVSMLACHRDCR